MTSLSTWRVMKGMVVCCVLNQKKLLPEFGAETSKAIV